MRDLGQVAAGLSKSLHAAHTLRQCSAQRSELEGQVNQSFWVTTKGGGTDSGRPMMEEPAGEEQMVGFLFKGFISGGGTRCGPKPLRVSADHLVSTCHPCIWRLRWKDCEFEANPGYTVSRCAQLVSCPTCLGSG